MSRGEQNIAGPAVATGELVRAGFGLASVGRLKWTQAFFAGNPVIQEEGCSIGDFDFAKLSPQEAFGWNGSVRSSKSRMSLELIAREKFG